MYFLQCFYLFVYFQEKTKFVNEIEKHKESLKKLSDEVEKIKIVIGNLPEVRI